MSKKERVIGIITDVHGLLEPLESVLLDMKKNNITEIYSLGDNILEGPNSLEVLELLEKYNVRCIRGNSEDYIILGTDAFDYLDKFREEDINNTKNYISKYINNLYINPHSIELLFNNKRIGLCHYLNDVRFDFYNDNIYNYKNNVNSGKKDSYKQFINLNTDNYNNKVLDKVIRFKDSPCNRGYYNSYIDPLFSGKTLNNFDYIFQGHVHFKLNDLNDNINIYTLRACGMGYNLDNKDLASYTIVKGNSDNTDIIVEERLVKYNRDCMLDKLNKDKNKYRRILSYVR